MRAFLPWFTADAEAPLGFADIPTLAVLQGRDLLRQSQRGLVLDGGAPLEHRLDDMRQALESAGCISPLRSERMPVFFDPAEAAVAHIDRSAMRILGLWAVKVHLNGLVMSGKRFPDIWLSRRSENANADAGKLDTMVAGGLAVGLSTEATLLKEAREEVGLPPCLAVQAEQKGQLRTTYSSSLGLHREILVIHDLLLPPSFVPENCDGEVSECLKLTWDEFSGALGNGQSFKHSSYLVSRDVAQRYGMM